MDNDNIVFFDMLTWDLNSCFHDRMFLTCISISFLNSLYDILLKSCLSLVTRIRLSIHVSLPQTWIYTYISKIILTYLFEWVKKNIFTCPLKNFGNDTKILEFKGTYQGVYIFLIFFLFKRMYHWIITNPRGLLPPNWSPTKIRSYWLYWTILYWLGCRGFSSAGKNRRC